MEIETHPHPAFVPNPLRTLIVGSFPGRPGTLSTDPKNQWYYSALRSQFWKIMETALQRPLPNKTAKMAELGNLGIGIADILFKIKRKKPTNADEDLEILEYNNVVLEKILTQNPKVKICFTSRFVEKHFKKCFPEHHTTYLLPSPSPRYARLSIQQKAAIYREILFK